jgi:hypothetical protein
MTRRFSSITKLLSEADLKVLMEIALLAEDPADLWRLGQDRLSAPSIHSRRTSVRVFQKWYLDGGPPKSEPAVLAWHVFPDPQVRREVLHLERCRHLALLDDLVCDVMYPRLGRGQLSLFGEESHELTSTALDEYVIERLPSLSRETRHETRNKLRLLLVRAGLVQRIGGDFGGTWRYTYYRPTWQAWLYGLYREFQDTGHRKRSEEYVAQRSRLTRRFLIRPADVPALLSEGARCGALEFETFAGQRYVRLTYENVLDLLGTLRARRTEGG